MIKLSTVSILLFAAMGAQAIEFGYLGGPEGSTNKGKIGMVRARPIAVYDHGGANGTFPAVDITLKTRKANACGYSPAAYYTTFDAEGGASLYSATVSVIHNAKAGNRTVFVVGSGVCDSGHFGSEQILYIEEQ